MMFSQRIDEFVRSFGAVVRSFGAVVRSFGAVHKFFWGDETGIEGFL